MATCAEIVPDMVLCSLYIYLLLRIVTASERQYKTPFYVFFTATGFYSVVAVLAYQFLLLFQFNENFWTYRFYKILYALNAFGACGATWGKVAIAVHRYYVMRRRDFAERGWSGRLVLRVLAAQFAISVIETASIWPASFVYMHVEGRDIIVGIDRVSLMIQKAHAVIDIVFYAIINSVCTFLTSRELYRMRSMIEGTTTTSRAIIDQQRRMYIVVTVCSLSHLIKAAHQFVIFVATQFKLDDLYYSISPLYPLFNGLATYAAPFCLVLLSPRLRSRLVFASGRLPALVSPTGDQSVAKF